MAGGNFTANLNSNGLKLNVKNYKLKNNNINLDLYDAASSYENIDYTTSEENINTNLNTNDFDFGESISKASNQLQEIKSTQEEEKPWWDVVFDYAATAVGSVVSGVVDVVENIGDGLIMCGGELASGVVSLCGNEDLASEIKKGTQDIVQYDWSEAGYDAVMDALDVDDEQKELMKKLKSYLMKNNDISNNNSLVGSPFNMNNPVNNQKSVGEINKQVQPQPEMPADLNQLQKSSQLNQQHIEESQIVFDPKRDEIFNSIPNQ